jgi:hypothetical protein
MVEMSEFKQNLNELLNQYNTETESNAEDFILAKYLKGCLDVFERVITPRADWHGQLSQIGGVGGIEGTPGQTS